MKKSNILNQRLPNFVPKLGIISEIIANKVLKIYFIDAFIISSSEEVLKDLNSIIEKHLRLINNNIKRYGLRICFAGVKFHRNKEADIYLFINGSKGQIEMKSYKIDIYHLNKELTESYGIKVLNLMDIIRLDGYFPLSQENITYLSRYFCTKYHIRIESTQKAKPDFRDPNFDCLKIFLFYLKSEFNIEINEVLIDKIVGFAKDDLEDVTISKRVYPTYELNLKAKNIILSQDIYEIQKFLRSIKFFTVFSQIMNKNRIVRKRDYKKISLIINLKNEVLKLHHAKKKDWTGIC